jgi:hypothetical protein
VYKTQILFWLVPRRLRLRLRLGFWLVPNGLGLGLGLRFRLGFGFWLRFWRLSLRFLFLILRKNLSDRGQDVLH